MFIVEFKERNCITGELYTPCGTEHTRFYNYKRLSTVIKHLKQDVKPPKKTEQVYIFNNNKFIQEFPVKLIGSNYQP